MSSTCLSGMEFTQASEAFSQPAASFSRSLKSFKERYPQSVPRNREDYPFAVDSEDDLDIIVEVLPVPTILYGQELSTEDGFVIFDDETNTNESVQYFNDEDLFGRLNSDSESDYFNHQGGDQGQEDIEVELSEDMLFDNDWDSDDTMTNARFVLRHIRRDREAKETIDVALRDTVPAAEDGAQYFDADDLFEREEAEVLVYGRDWYSEE